MNINPKDRRNYHRLSVEQKKVLFTAIHKAVDNLIFPILGCIQSRERKDIEPSFGMGKAYPLGFCILLRIVYIARLSKRQWHHGFPTWKDIIL